MIIPSALSVLASLSPMDEPEYLQHEAMMARIVAIANKKGNVIGEKIFNGRNYKLINIVNIFVLVNQDNQPVIIVNSFDDPIQIVFRRSKIRRSIPVGSTLSRIALCNDRLFLGTTSTGKGAFLVVHDINGKVLFGILNPGKIMTNNLLPLRTTENVF